MSMNIEILREDARWVAILKPSGMLVHRGWANDPRTALDLARDRLGRHVYPVHRLDRPTSGALLFALDPESARSLHALFEAGAIDKRYLAIVRGVPPEEGLIDHPIPRREGGPRVHAVTAFRRLHAGDRFALVAACPRTGRLHQVRRHLKHINHPVIGDSNYGKSSLNSLFRERFGLARLALHAAELSFTDPWTGARVRIAAPLPDDLRGPLERMGVMTEALSITGAPD